MILNYFAIPGLKFKVSNSRIDQVAILVCTVMNVNAIRLISKSRLRTHVDARGLCYLVLKSNNPNISLKEIGKFFNRDHTTIMHGIKEIKNDLLHNEFLQSKLVEIQSRIQT